MTRLAAAVAAALLSFATPAEAEDAADLAAAYLRGAQLENGLFRYEYDFLTGAWSKKDNIVRQAGAAFGLAIYHQQRPHEPTRQAVERALTALAALSLSYGGGLLVSDDGSLQRAKAGATALALAAALLADIDSAPIEGWRDGLLALQREDGRFRQSPVNHEASGYYDGESWLALALLAAKHGDGASTQALALTDAAMMDGYGGAADVTFYHWGQLAAATRYGATLDPSFIDFAAAQTESFLDKTRPKVSTNSNSCYSLEGLAAAYAMVVNDPRLGALADRIGERIRLELAHNLTIQVQPGQTSLSLRDGAELVAGELPDFAGAFLNGRLRPQARIDATQHCLAALLQLSALDFRLE